jgi:hypothetical protein
MIAWMVKSAVLCVIKTNKKNTTMLKKKKTLKIRMSPFQKKTRFFVATKKKSSEIAPIFIRKTEFFAHNNTHFRRSRPKNPNFGGKNGAKPVSQPTMSAKSKSLIKKKKKAELPTKATKTASYHCPK